MIVAESKNKKYNRPSWLCSCECGVQIEVAARSLVSGNTKSCGCFRKSTTAELGKSIRKHEMTGAPEYHAYLHMIARCYNKNHPQYKDYGGRGISVSERWLENFSNFFADIGTRPTENHSIERINNNNGYSQENCRWAMDSEQNNNRRNNRFIDFEDQNLTIAQWSRKTGITERAINYRLSTGWAISETLTKPSKVYRYV